MCLLLLALSKLLIGNNEQTPLDDVIYGIVSLSHGEAPPVGPSNIFVYIFLSLIVVPPPFRRVPNCQKRVVRDVSTSRPSTTTTKTLDLCATHSQRLPSG